MNIAILDSPLESLAFNYLTFGFLNVVNSIWTWIAVVTAGVSFWKIKTSSTLLAPEKPREDFSGDRSTQSPAPQMLVTSSSSSEVERLQILSSTQQVSSMSRESTSSSTKGKLTVYFREDEGREECNGDGEGFDQEGDDDNDDDVELSKEWFENWEKLLKMKKGEREWYRYQDMKVIDGSIVRLWEGSRRRREVEITAFSVGVVSAW